MFHISISFLGRTAFETANSASYHEGKLAAGAL